jgi:hypothetical protein
LGEKRNTYRILMGMPERGHKEDLDIGARTILKWILTGRMGWYGLD